MPDTDGIPTENELGREAENLSLVDIATMIIGHSDFQLSLLDMAASEPIAQGLASPPALLTFKTLALKAARGLVDPDEMYHKLFLPGNREAIAGLVGGWSEYHIDAYTPVAEQQAALMADFVEETGQGALFVEKSGMYGAKTTLSFLLLDKLQHDHGFVPYYLIFDGLQEDVITARSMSDPSQRERPATRFGMSNYLNVIGNMIEIQEADPNTRRVVLLDEFPFLPPRITETFVRRLTENGISVILTGLDTDALGRPTPGFRDERMKPYVENSYQCHSFVYPHDTLQEPTGVATNRYIRLGNRLWVLDLGLGEGVISKTAVNVVEYRSAREEDSIPHLLADHHELLHQIQNPGDEEIGYQIALTEYITRRYPLDEQV